MHFLLHDVDNNEGELLVMEIVRLKTLRTMRCGALLLHIHLEVGIELQSYNIQILDTIHFKYQFENHIRVVMYTAAELQYGWARDDPTWLLVRFFKQLVSSDYATRIVRR